MIWLAGFTELFNWSLSLNSTDSQLPMWKGWIFPLADDMGEKQQESVVLQEKKTPTSFNKNITYISAALVLSHNLDNRDCHVEEMLKRINLSELVFVCQPVTVREVCSESSVLEWSSRCRQENTTTGYSFSLVLARRLFIPPVLLSYWLLLPVSQ